MSLPADGDDRAPVRQGIRNPYVRMQLTFDPARFYGRRGMSEAIIDGISRPDPSSFVISGFKLNGKTSLWRNIEATASTRISSFAIRPVFVYVDFYHLEVDKDRVFATIYDQIVADPDMQEILQGKYGDLGKLEPHVSDPGTVVDFLMAARVRKTLPVICLDHFDRVVQTMSHEIEAGLLGMKRHACLIVLLEKPASALLDAAEYAGGSSDLFQAMIARTLGALAEDEATALIREPAAAVGAPFTDNEIQFLRRKAGRHPYVLLLACEWLFRLRQQYRPAGDSAGQWSVISQPWVESDLDEQERLREVLNILWRRLTPDEQRLLHAIAAGSGTLDEHAASQAERTARSGLRSKNLVDVDVEGTYRVAGELLASWAMNAGLRPPPRARDLSEIRLSLAPRDRELFEYLSERENQVCPSSELYAQFWQGKDAKTALAAAVSRIRATLEENADAEWDYIRNIRGVGYRFSRPPAD